MTTFVEFVTGLSGCTIAGVPCQLSTPPLSLNTADLPASWVGLPTGEQTPLTFCGGYFPSFDADLVIAVEPVGQSRQPENYEDCLALIDAVNTALCGCQITKTKLTWSIRIDIILVADVAYWAVVANVTGAG